LLRRLHATLDRRGDQFVVRRSAPPPPPDASRLPLWYVRGGGMLLRAGVSPKEEGMGAYLVDSAFPFPLSLSDAAWKKAGVDISKLNADPNMPNLRTGPVPLVRFASFDLPQVPAVQGAPAGPAQQSIDVDLDGVVGSGLIAEFRVTFGEDGRFVWLEPDPVTMQARGRGAPPSASDAAPPPMVPDPAAVPPPGAKPGAAPSKSDKSAPATKPAPTPSPGAKKEQKPEAKKEKTP
jgi:hypothetical protein